MWPFKPKKVKCNGKLEDNKHNTQSKIIYKSKALKSDCSDNEKSAINEHKTQRFEQLKIFKYIRWCAGIDSPKQCRNIDQQILHNNKDNIEHWLNCEHSPRCYCQLFGESEKSVKRKKLTLPD